MSKRRFIVLAIVLAVAAACSSGTPEDDDVGARSSGTPAPQESSSGTANSGSSDTISDDGDITSIPSDVAQPPTVPPPPPPPPTPPPAPPPVVAVCGDLTLESDEQCDDGNTQNWDGCTSTCQVEIVPTVDANFANDDGNWSNKFKPTGSVTYGIADVKADDQNVVGLVFAGSPGPSPSNSSQIRTKTFLGFGMYRARVSLATCAANEEAVNGIFVYSYSGGSDGTTTLPVDGNANGIKDNNEIDFEVLCGEPQYLWMSSWTDYQDVGGVETFRKVTRVVDMTTGKAYQTVPGKEGKYGLGSTVVETIPDAVTPGFATTGAFYELGFDWQPTFIRFFIVLNNKEVTLWTFNDANHPNGASYIPQNKAAMMFNLWHTTSHWYVGGAAVSPANPATMNVDWFKFWPG